MLFYITRYQSIMIMNPNRFFYCFWIAITILIGLLSRTKLALSYLPDFGDMLYAIMFYGIVAFLFPKAKPIKIGLGAILCCFLIECSQLYDANWFNAIRNNRLGRLILGYGFQWMDLVHYTIGGVLAMLLDSMIHKDKV